MSPISLSFSLPIIAASMLVKASLLLAAAAIIDAALRSRSSAAARHLLWTLAITGLLLLPALSAGLPHWSIPIRLPAGWTLPTSPTALDAAPLPAASQLTSVQPAATESAAGQRGLGTAQRVATQPAPAQPAAAAQTGPAQPGSAQLGPAQRDPAQRGLAQLSPAQLGPAQPGAAQGIAARIGGAKSDGDADAPAAARTRRAAAAAVATAAPATAGARTTVAPDTAAMSPREVARSVAADGGRGGDATRAAAAGALARAAAGVSWTALLLMLYAAGALVLLARLGMQQLAVRRLARQAVVVGDPEWTRLFAECAASLRLARPVRLLRSRERSMPMTFGTRRPVILLPAIADTWSDDRRRAVLLHELAHVARLDCLTQTLATLTCALYWLHPGAWWVARRLRIERELACDDRVLTAGTRARDYAGHLLEIAYSLGGGRAPALVVTMARPRQLEGRMLAVLDDSRNRALPPPRSRVVAIALTALLLLPLAALEGTATPTEAATVAATDATALPALPVLPRNDLNARAPQQLDAAGAALTAAARQGSLRPDTLARNSQTQTLDAPESDGLSASQPQADAEATSATPPPQAGSARVPQQPVPLRSPTSAFFATLASKALDAFTGTAAPAPAPSPAPAPAGTGAQERVDGRQPGTWEIRPTTDVPAQSGMVYLRLTEMSKDGGHWSSGTTVPLARLEGLTQAQLAGAGGTVTFHIRRDAGTFTFDGVFRNGVGAGTYGFAPDASFPDQLVKRGIGRPTADQQYEMARMDVGIAFLDELTAQNYQRPEIADLVRAAQHGVSLDYLHDMGSFGYRLGLLEPLIRMRDHGVTVRFIRDLATDGFTHLSPEDLVRIRDHGVNAEYLAALRDAGYRSVSLEQAINARDHGISREFIREMGDMGYTKLPLEELISVRDHGVSADYARQMKALGYPMTLAEMIKARDHGVSDGYVREMTAAGFGKLSLDELIDARNHGVSADYARQMKEMGYQASLADLANARDHGVSADYVRQMDAAGYGKLPLDALVRTRDHGVTPDYASSLKALGYDRIALDDLIDLRDHGVTAERIRKANSRAGTRLPLDMIKSLADGGMR